ncbi:MAG: hypothetical protein K5681_08665 [Treponema sp.]|nr:hypothetical protein [Treponema sp.]
MEKEEVGSKIKDWFSKGAKASKEALDKAGSKVQDFSDKSVKKLEIHKIEANRDCKYEELGLKISQMLLEGATVNTENAEDLEILLGIQSEIKELSDQIAKKEAELEN